jgi:hypothetical protein
VSPAIWGDVSRDLDAATRYAKSAVQQGCSVLYGNAMIRAVVADIASPDLKSPSYQDLILVSPNVGARGSLKEKFFGIRKVGAGRCQDQVLA